MPFTHVVVRRCLTLCVEATAVGPDAGTCPADRSASAAQSRRDGEARDRQQLLAVGTDPLAMAVDATHGKAQIAGRHAHVRGDCVPRLVGCAAPADVGALLVPFAEETSRLARNRIPIASATSRLARDRIPFASKTSLLARSRLPVASETSRRAWDCIPFASEASHLARDCILFAPETSLAARDRLRLAEEPWPDARAARLHARACSRHARKQVSELRKAFRLARGGPLFAEEPAPLTGESQGKRADSTFEDDHLGRQQPEREDEPRLHRMYGRKRDYETRRPASVARTRRRRNRVPEHSAPPGPSTLLRPPPSRTRT